MQRWHVWESRAWSLIYDTQRSNSNDLVSCRNVVWPYRSDRIPLSAADQQSIAIATQNEDEKMGFKPFMDIDSNPVADGAHPIGKESPDASPASEEEG